MEKYSKFKQPRWDHSEDYEYLKHIRSKRVWAWEFLRRSPDYRRAYDQYSAQAQKFKEEYGRHWKKRRETYQPVLRAEGAARKIPLDKVYGAKFHLQGMYDYRHSYEQGVRFLRVSKFPEIIRTVEDFYDYVQIKDIYNEGDEFPVAEITEVPSNYAVIVFDLTLNIAPQFKKARKFLDGHISDLKKQGELKTDRTRIITQAWKRHLQILDALNLPSPPDTKDILYNTGFNEERIKREEHPGNQAHDNINLALDMAKRGYVKILLSAENKMKKKSPPRI